MRRQQPDGSYVDLGPAHARHRQGMSVSGVTFSPPRVSAGVSWRNRPTAAKPRGPRENRP